jgi:hypothetical protein
MNEDESAAMWEMYGMQGSGIALLTRFSRLSNSFACYDRDVRIGMVKYIDYMDPDVDVSKAEGARELFLFKRRSFEHERELRVMVDCLSQGDIDTFAAGGYPQYGIYVPADLEILIEEIRVHPDSQDWFLELVRNIVRKYGLDKVVRRSSIADDPIY